MSDLEGGAYLKTVEAGHDRRSGFTPPPEAPEKTIDDIRKNDSQELSAWLEHHGDRATQDLGKRWLEDKLTGTDLTKGLPDLQRRFLADKKVIDDMGRVIAHEALGDIKKRSPEMAALCNVRGDEQMAMMLEQGIKTTGFNDKTKFNEMRTHVQQIERVKKEIADSTKNIDEFCQKFNISDAEFANAMGNVDEKTRTDMLRDYASLSGGIFFRFNREMRTMTAEMAGKKGEFDRIMADKISALGNTGKLFARYIETDDKWKEAMVRSMDEALPTFKDDPENLESFDNARLKQKDYSVEGLKSGIEKERIDALFKSWGKKWNGKWEDQAQADEAERTIMGNIQKEMRERVGGGFFAALLHALFGRSKSDPRIKDLFTFKK